VNRARRELYVDGMKLTAFLLATCVMAAVLVVTTGNMHPGKTHSYFATFEDVSYLAPGDDVRVASVSVGQVESVTVGRSGSVRVGFNLDDSIELTSTTTATVRYKNLVGDRYLQLAPGASPGEPMSAGDSLDPRSSTSALDLDTLLDGFKPLFVGLNPGQINELSGQLVQTLQGQQGAVYRLVSTVASFTSTVATREEVIGRVVTNLNAVLGSLDAHGDSVGVIIDQLALLVGTLSRKAPSILDAADRIDDMATQAASLLGEARTTVKPNLTNLRAVAESLDANSHTIQSLLSKWPHHYETVLRSASFGNFINFFLCGVRFRLSPEESSNPIQLPWMTSEADRCKP